MKLHITALAALIGLCQTGYVWSGPLMRGDVPADASWVVHLDADALRAAPIGKTVLSELAKEESAAKLDAFAAAFRFDPRTQLHGLSVFGKNGGSDGAIIVAYGEFDAAHLVTLVKAAKDFVASTHGNHQVYSWVDNDKTGAKRKYGTIVGKRILLSESQDALGTALDVIDKTAPALTTSQAFSALGKPATGKFLQIAAHELPIPKNNPVAALLKQAKEIQMDFSSADDKVNMAMDLSVPNAEVAGQLNSIAQGLLAFLKLQADKPEQTRWAEKLTVKQNGAVVRATAAIPTADVMAMLKSKARKKGAE